MTCGVAHLGFSGLSFCIILQAILADCCGSPFALCWRIFADSFSLSSLPAVMCGCAGKYLTWVSIFATEYCLSVTVPVSGCWKEWFPLQGCLVTSLLYFSQLASPANLLGTSSQAHQLAMSLIEICMGEPEVLGH